VNKCGTSKGLPITQPPNPAYPDQPPRTLEPVLAVTLDLTVVVVVASAAVILLLVVGAVAAFVPPVPPLLLGTLVGGACVEVVVAFGAEERVNYAFFVELTGISFIFY
jgi:hypothetical protein